jgi:hypothetical protein
MKPSLTVTTDFTDEFNKIIARFKNDEVLVGIPEQESTREEGDEEGEPINNAALLALNNFGSPAQNIPARPVMELGIAAAQEDIADQYRLAVVNALKNGVPALSIYYNRAGLIASNSIKKVINKQEGFKGPSDATLRTRKSEGFKGTKALIVTAQMRNAITYVVKGEE